MRDFLIARGIPANVITVETRSASTYQNAVFSRDLLNSIPGKKVLLTSDFHMYRAIRVFHKAGIDITPRSIPDVLRTSASPTGRPAAAVQEGFEIAKIAYYRLHGWI
jgi:uncharacterized SAM-binding protein YcdF (DUF218 family)